MGSKKQEEVADIVSELRDNSRWFSDVGEQLVTKQSIATLFWMIADRIEAAWKRERAEIEAQALSFGGIVEAARHTQKPQGNAAALREAAETALSELDKFGQCHDARLHFADIVHVGNARGMLQNVLSAPARNCDAMPWRKAWDEWRAKHHPQNPQTFNESYEATVAFMEWFTAPASEKGATA